MMLIVNNFNFLITIIIIVMVLLELAVALYAGFGMLQQHTVQKHYHIA